MTVTLRPEQERVVGEAIDAGLIDTADDVVDVGVETIRQRLQARTGGAHGQAINAAPDRLLKFGQKYRLLAASSLRTSSTKGVGERFRRRRFSCIDVVLSR